MQLGSQSHILSLGIKAVSKQTMQPCAPKCFLQQAYVSVNCCKFSFQEHLVVHICLDYPYQ